MSPATAPPGVVAGVAAVGRTWPDPLGDALSLGEELSLGLTDALSLGLTEPLGETLSLGLTLSLGEALSLGEGLGLGAQSTQNTLCFTFWSSRPCQKSL